MKHDLICSWLNLPPETWPPDHYALLGLPPGEADLARIEHRVHERLARLRCYQLSHPEQATAAMNLLAQAFCCLSDPAAKRAYDAAHFPDLTPPRPPAVLVAAAVPALPSPAAPPLPAPYVATVETVTDAAPTSVQTQVDWQTSAPPVRIPPATVTAIVPVAAPAVEKATPRPSAAITTVVAAPDTQVSVPLFEEASSSPAARRGLGTKRALFERVTHTRELRQAWERAGRYLNKPARRLSRNVEVTDLVRSLRAVVELLDGFPPLLGRPGQPGYRVIALARRPNSAEEFKGYDAEQRELLARDWQTGHALLTAHCHFLRAEVRKVRRTGWIGQGVRAVRAVLNDYPDWVWLCIVPVVVAACLFAVWLWQS
jgi:hypothetical protein